MDTGDAVSLAIAGGMTGMEAVVTKDNPPTVTTVALNYPGANLSYPVYGGNVSATKNGSSYQLKGTAGGLDGATKPFEIDLTCS